MGPGQCREGPLVITTLSNLYLGQSMPQGGEVSPLAFDHFLADVVAGMLPNGFTVSEGVGFFRSQDGRTMRERVKVISLAHDGSETAFRLLDTIRNVYKARFAQESTLRVDLPAGGECS